MTKRAEQQSEVETESADETPVMGDDDSVRIVPVDDYPERPYEEAKAPDVVLDDVPDQIPDYHTTHPTLKAEGAQYDANVAAQLLSEAQQQEG